MGTIDVFASTTGLLSPVTLQDLGYLDIVHPDTVNLTDIFDASDLADSDDLQLAITNGTIVLTDDAGQPINSVRDIQIGLAPSTGPAIGLFAYATTDANGNLLESRGIASCTLTATGVYAYLFENQAPSSLYSVSAQPENLPVNTDTNIFIGSKSLNGFEVRIGIGDNGTSADVLQNRQHSVWVLGPSSVTSIEGGISSDIQPVQQNSIVVYSDNTGNIVTDSDTTLDAQGLSLNSGSYRLNGQPLALGDLANVLITAPQANDILAYDGANWINIQPKTSWSWAGALNTGSASGTRSFEGMDGIRLDRSPYFAFTDCVIYAITLTGLNLNEQWFLDIMVNNSQLVSFERLPSQTANAYTGQAIAIAQGSTVWLRYRRVGGGNTDYPQAIVYVKEA